jgi:Glutamine synthetase
MPYVIENGKKVPRSVTLDETLKSLKELKFVSMQFADLRGKLQHFSIPSYEINENVFKEGFPKVDGSSIMGFTDIDDSDLVFIPDISTFSKIPWNQKEARFIGGIMSEMSTVRLDSDSRAVAENVQKFLTEKGLTAFFGPEVEFFVFDDVRFDAEYGYRQYYKVISNEAPFSQNPLKMREKQGYYPETPVDSLAEYRNVVSEYLYSFWLFTIGPSS